MQYSFLFLVICVKIFALCFPNDYLKILSSAVFSVSNSTWNDRSCSRKITEDPDFIVDRDNERLLLDGNENTCLPPLNIEKSALRIDAYVYTPMTDKFVLNITVTNVVCESPGIIVYYGQGCASVNEGGLFQCHPKGSNSMVTQSDVISCTFACISPFMLQLKTRVVIRMEMLPWETKQPRICGLSTILTWIYQFLYISPDCVTVCR